MQFLNFLLSMDKLRNRADKIRSDEEKREKSSWFAVSSMICSLVAVALAAVGGVLLSIVSENIVLTILFIGFASVILLGAFVSLFWAVVRLVWQFKINKSAWSWIALAVLIAAVVAAIIIELHFIGQVL